MKAYDPDETYLVGDNVEAMRLLVDAGILDQLKPRGTANTAHYHFQTADHWCSGSNHIGHEKESDNGYMVIMVPKSKMDMKQAGQFFATMITEYHEGPDNLTFGYSVVGPKENN